MYYVMRSICCICASVLTVASAHQALAQVDGRLRQDDAQQPSAGNRSELPTAQPATDRTPTAVRHELKSLETVDRYEAPAVNQAQVSFEDQQREAQGLPPRFAIPNDVSLTPDNSGTWEEIDPNTGVWRLVVSSPGAASLNLGFSSYHMTENGRLMIYAADGSHVVRPFTVSDNAAHGELWSPVVVADEVVVELTIPYAELPQLELELTSVNVGYRGFGADDGAPVVASGSCNVDVICPKGDDWPLEIQSVAVISTGGSTFCSGFMVNNTAQDLTPFFMTAQHCGITSGNAGSLVTYWNYENSYCRVPGSPDSGGPGDGTLDQFNTGAFWRASYGPSDMTLVELDSDPDPAWDVGYAGWDRTSADPQMAIAIHHPNTDEKRISFEFDPTTTTTYLETPVPGDGTHIRVEDWDVGTTEPGSSGSPLFDQNHRVTGQLHGGFASCTSQTADWYGRFSVSWTGGGTNSSRLSNWLDPGNTGAAVIDSVSLTTLCSSAGEITLARDIVGCVDSVLVTVVDCDLNIDEKNVDTVDITVTSDTDPTGETVTLTETGVNTARFEGPVALDSAGGVGMVQVSAGDTVTATYEDDDDGTGSPATVTATAIVDCTPPVISNVMTSVINPHDATVEFDTNEPSVGTVHFGLSCGSLNSSASGTELSTSPSVTLPGLADDVTYFYSVEAADEAGNEASDDNGGACYSFTTPETPDFFTEEFDGDNDLDNISLTFTPVGGVDYYAGCATSISALPTDPGLGATPDFSPNDDDGSDEVFLTGGETITFYGVEYDSLSITTNGYVTFGGSDTDYTESLEDHFDLPRISLLFDDLDPGDGGAVRWIQLADRVVVTWDGVPEYSTTNSNTFQLEFYFDGTIVMSYLSVAATDGIAGLSAGEGVSEDYLEMDLSLLSSCGPADCNNNSVPDDEDIAMGTSLDCNENGVPDECDLDSGTSGDCNGNAIPDECDVADGTSPDCNGNNVPDDCELASGASDDCNSNGIPDECDVASGFSDDCNGNNVPDVCDLASGTSDDCNGNSVPDECDVASGFSEDCNGNNVPDVCDVDSGTTPDCNGNGVPDSCDVSDETSLDCNNNGVPDECDVDGGASLDCNANDVPDECDVSSGSSPDCNSNATPDECDVASGSSPDVDENGTPDECELEAPEMLTAGSRTLGISARPVGGAIPIALRVSGSAGDTNVSCLVAYAQTNGSLGASPVYQLPSAWGDLFLVGSDIIPSANYEVRSQIDTGAMSPMLLAETGLWADVDGDEFVNLADALMIIQAIEGGDPAPMAVLDIWPCEPDGFVNLDEALHIVLAIEGQTYADEGCPVVCP